MQFTVVASIVMLLFFFSRHSVLYVWYDGHSFIKSLI